MISIIRAAEEDFQTIVNIGNTSVGDAHKDSASAEDMSDYLSRNYNKDAITGELSDLANIYHIISYNESPVGFSKIIMNASHPNIALQNIAKLDRIYLLKEFFGLKLGLELLQFNIELAKHHQQSGIWLYTWIGNSRALRFYLKAGFTIIGSHRFYVTKEYYNLNHQMFLNLS